jgi:hypothetical protein
MGKKVKSNENQFCMHGNFAKKLDLQHSCHVGNNQRNSMAENSSPGSNMVSNVKRDSVTFSKISDNEMLKEEEKDDFLLVSIEKTKGEMASKKRNPPEPPLPSLRLLDERKCEQNSPSEMASKNRNSQKPVPPPPRSLDEQRCEQSSLLPNSLRSRSESQVKSRTVDSNDETENEDYVDDFGDEESSEEESIEEGADEEFVDFEDPDLKRNTGYYSNHFNQQQLERRIELLRFGFRHLVFRKLGLVFWGPDW